MTIYLLEFFLILLIITKIDCNKSSKSKKNIVLLITAILIASLIGGLRDFTIGTDVNVYGKRWFEVASKAVSFNSYIGNFNTTEYGYLLLNYIVSRFTSDVNIFLFILQLICNTLVFSTLYHYRDKCPLWASILMYLCTFYCMSFNILRQACALSIIFACTIFLEKKEIIKYILGTAIALFFHSSALLAGVMILGIYFISKTKPKKQFIIIFIAMCTLGIGLSYIKEVIAFGYNIGIVNERIYNYIFIFVKDNLEFPLVEFLFKTLFLFVCLISLKKTNKDFKYNNFLFICILFDLILSQTKMFISYSERFSFYLGYISMIYIPQSFNALSKNRNNKFIINMLFTSVMLTYWVYNYVIEGHCEVYPYKSIILGI